MKVSIIALSLGLVCSLAHADLAQDHAKKCETEEVKILTGGKKQSCQVVVAPKKVETKGVCVGSLGSLPCAVIYVSSNEGSALRMVCGENPDAPLFDQIMSADVLGYNVATFISTPDKTIIQNDENDYLLVSNQMLDIRITETKDASGKVVKAGTMSAEIEKQKVPLKNVTCY